MSESSKTIRPYYDSETFNVDYTAVYRPSVGVIDEQGNTIASKILQSSNVKRSMNNIGIGKPSLGKSLRPSIRNLVTVSDYNGNIKKNMYSDLEFSEYFELSNINELLKSLVQSFVNNYLRCLVAQPFEVARLLLQVGDFSIKNEVNETPSSNEIKSYDDDDDDDDEIDYFQPVNADANLAKSRTRVVRRARPRKDEKNATMSKSSSKMPTNCIRPVSLNTVDIMSSLLAFEGARGLWRANNATFILNALTSTLEAWITGFMSPFFQIPDPFFVDVTHSPDPTTTLLLSITASVLSGLLLAPLDLIRTRLIVTSINKNERSIRNSIRNLKFFTCPLSLIIPTVLNSVVTNLFKKLTPYLLFVKFGIDSYGSPILHSASNLLSSIFELFLKLPVETILRRAQVNYLLKGSDEKGEDDLNSLKIKDQNQMIVKFAGYSGLFSTPFDILYGSTQNSGVQALFRGWRVGLLNIFGSWGLRILQTNYDDQIYKEEKF